MARPSLIVTISANISDLSRNLDAAEKRLLKAGERLEKVGSDLSLKVTAPLVALSAAFAKSAADDAASVEKMGRAFGAATGQMDGFIKSLMKSVPATDDQLRTLASSTDTLFKSMGFAPAKAMAMSQSVLKLAGDLAAYNHVSLDSATDTIEKAMAGRTRGLVELNVAVTEADVKAKAYQMGLAKVGDELSSTAKAQATLAAIVERSGAQQGEAARTYNNNENALARLKQAADGVADSFGALVLPAFVKVTDAAGGFLDTLTALPDSAKGVVVAIGAIAAAAPILLIVAGNLVKSITILGSLKAIQSAGAFLALAAQVRSLSGAVALAQMALGGLLSSLLIPAAILAPIAAVGYLWYKSGESAREAAKKVDEFTTSLALMNKEQVKSATMSLQTQFDSVTAGLTAAQRKLAGIHAPALTGGFAAGKGADPAQAAAAAQANALRDQIRDLTAARNGIAQQMVAAGQRFNALTAPGVTTPPPGGVTGDGKDPFASLEEYAGRLGRLYELTTAKGHPLVGLTGQITQTIDGLTAALARQKDQWSETAVKIREALEALTKYGQATLLPGGLNGKLPSLTYAQAVGSMANAGAVAGARATAVNTTGLINGMGDVRGVTSPLTTGVIEPAKQAVTLQTRMVQQLSTLPEQFASSLGSFLGPVLARMGGGTGGAIGAALGGGIGGAVGKAVVGNIGALAGKGIGAAIGSAAIPVVGTIVGSIAGSFIGGTIGKLFGGGGKSAAEKAAEQLQKLADAAQKVNEAINGLPQGIKVASYRYDATNPDGVNGQSGLAGAIQDAQYPGLGYLKKYAPGVYGTVTGGSGGGGNHFYGPITVNGVTDVPSFFRQLSTYAETQGARGGVNGLQLAMGT